jgi:hypothetical protein
MADRTSCSTHWQRTAADPGRNIIHTREHKARFSFFQVACQLKNCFDLDLIMMHAQRIRESIVGRLNMTAGKLVLSPGREKDDCLTSGSGVNSCHDGGK